MCSSTVVGLAWISNQNQGKAVWRENNQLSLYNKYHVDKDYTSIGLFRALKEKYAIDKVFYPGCYVHITPSLVFPDVTYADSFKNTFRFFNSDDVLAFVKVNKEYPEEPVIRYYQQDYKEPFTALTEEFDLVISQYAGFVGQAVKAYLKTGGLLVCNNSHGDASMAALDPCYELAGVYKRKTDASFTISDKNLQDYLVPKSGVTPTKEQLEKTMRGIAYVKSPSGYIYRKTACA